MALVTATREVRFPVSEVWTVLDDFGGIHRWSAGVEASPIIEGTPSSGVGAERNCALYDGNHILERVTESRENEKLSIEVVETSMPMKSAVAEFTLQPTAAGGTRVTMSMDYIVKFGPLGQLMDLMMMKRMMNATLGRILGALDHHLATGELVGKDWTPSAATAPVATTAGSL